MPDVLHLDLESACDLDLTKVGLDRYSADPSCRVLMAAYRINDGSLQHWQAQDGPLPSDLRDALLDPSCFRWAFNAQFERVMTRRVLKLKTPVEGWRCSMCLAYTQSFTGGLADIGEQIGLPQDKLKKKEGDRLIRLFSMPQRPTKNQPYIWRNWLTDPDDWQEFADYNCQDVVAEEAVKSRLIRFPIQDSEWSFYRLDQIINDRGMPLDQQFVHNVIWMSERRKNELLSEMAAVTRLNNPNSRDQILPWLQANSYPYDDLRKETVEKALNRAPELWDCSKDASDDEAPPVVRVLRRRQWSSKTSISKAVAARRTVGPGGRVRFMYQFAGASRTNRFCIAEGSLVLVRNQQGRIRNVPIERVTSAYQVWDGNSWVEHSGVVFSGVKPVILYEGVLATQEHVVYAADRISLTLGDAARIGLHLWEGLRHDYAIYNLSGNFAVESLLRRDDQHIADCAMAGAPATCVEGRKYEAPVIQCDQEIRGGEFSAGSAAILQIPRGSAGCRDTSHSGTSAGGASLQCVSGGRGFKDGAREAQRVIDDRSSLVRRVPFAAIRGDQEESGVEGTPSHIRVNDKVLARAEPREGAGTYSKRLKCCEDLARAESGKGAGEQSKSQRCRCSLRKPGACCYSEQTEVDSDATRGARTLLCEETGECAAPVGAAKRRGQKGSYREDCSNPENPQRSADIGAARSGRGTVEEGSRKYRPFVSEEAAEGGFDCLLDTRASCSRIRGTERPFAVCTQGIARTYDLIHAGPRNRFLVSGKIVSNSGRGVQPQNMERTPKLLDAEDAAAKLDYATDLIRDGNYDGFDLFLAEPMLAFTGAMRGMFRAPDGYELQVCDYKSVESAGLAWLANCPRLLNVFREDRDPYLDFGTLFYQKPYEAITRAERQICKPPALACGYGMGAGAEKDGVKTGLLAYAENMGVEMTQDQSTRAVTVFREGYPEVPQFWYACDRAIRHVLTTHAPFEVGYLRFEWLKPYLTMQLPSGRRVFYYKPRLEQRVVNTGRTKMIRSRGVVEHGAPEGVLIEVPDTYVRTVFTYLGRNQRTTQWDRVEGRGALIVENADQAMTRDILKVGLQRLHKAGFYVIGHAHDEAIAMQKIGDNIFTLDLMKELFKAPIEWAPGFPLSASAWNGKYYRK